MRHIAPFYFGFRRISEVNPLPFESDPVVKPWLRVINLTSHMPFPNKCGFISNVLKIFREKDELVRERVVVVDHPVVMGVETCQD